jgi:hypothetical protein
MEFRQNPDILQSVFGIPRFLLQYCYKYPEYSFMLEHIPKPATLTLVVLL